MKPRGKESLARHFNKYFEQNDYLVVNSVGIEFNIDVLLYKPTRKYPFWKLVTMGASDYKMPPISNTVGMYNEYIMFVDQDENLTDRVLLKWYHKKLIMVALFAYDNKTHITYSHSFEWTNEFPEDEMIGAFLEFPMVIENEKLVQCRTGLFKKVACLQVVLLNKDDLNKLKEIGRKAFSYYLYPENNDKKHFLSEMHRTEKF